MKKRISKKEYYEISKSFVEYTNLLKQDRKDKKKNQLIETGMLPHENFNYKIINKLLPNGHKIKEFKQLGLEMKLIHLIQSLNYTNELIIQSNNLYKFLKKASAYENYMSVYNFHKLTFLNEDIVHMVKKFIDEIISVTYILKYDGDNIKVNSIGEYIKDGQNYLDEYDELKEYFIKLNDIDNAIKHSYSNTLSTGYFGRDENIIVVQYSKKGKKIYEPQTIYITINELVQQFNMFYQFSFQMLDNLLVQRNNHIIKPINDK